MVIGLRASRVAGRRASLPALLLVAACGSGGSTDGPGADPTGGLAVPGLHAPPVVPEELECERQGFPCSWVDVDSLVLRRSVVLGEEALGKSLRDGLPSARDWLAEQPGVAEVLSDSSGLVFRLEGGRRVWVDAELNRRRFGSPGLSHAHAVRVASPAMPATPAALFATGRSLSAAATPGSILGEDRNGDDKLNQRDRRRALVLDPYRHEVAEFGYQAGPRIAALLEGSEAYAGQVELLTDDAITLGAYQGWSDYDLITVFSHSGVKCQGDDCVWLLWLGIHLDPSLPVEEALALKAALEPVGLELRVRPASGGETLKTGAAAAEGDTLYWSVGATADFFRRVYPRGLDRKLILIGSCSSMDPAMIAAMTGPRRPEASAYFGFTNLVDALDAERAITTLVEVMVADGVSAREAHARLRGRGLTRFVDEDGVTELVGHLVRNPRAREIVTLVDGADRPLRDGGDLDSLVGGAIGDGVPDSLSVTALIEGVITGNEDPSLVNHTTGSEVVHMEAWLELDGQPIGRAEGLLDKPKTGNVIRVDFRDVPVGFDLQKDREYELEAVVSLPPEKDEEGASRYSVRLSDASCSWRISYSGARGGEYRGTFVVHRFDGSPFGPSHLTRQIGFAMPGVLGLTISFGGDGLPMGRAGSFLFGADELAGERLTLHLDLDFPWQNRMSGVNRPFSVRIDRNDRDMIAGSFQGNLMNVPIREPLPNAVNHGDVAVEGEFVWRRGKCRLEGGRR